MTASKRRDQVPFSMTIRTVPAQVFERTLVHGNSKIETRQRKTQRKVGRKERKLKEVQQTRKNKSRRPHYSSGLPFPRGRYSPKQWMNYLINLTYMHL